MSVHEKAAPECATGEFTIAVWRKAAPEDIAPLDTDWTVSLVEAVRQLRLPVTVTPNHFGFQTQADREAVLASANRRYEKALARTRRLRRLSGYLR